MGYHPYILMGYHLYIVVIGVGGALKKSYDSMVLLSYRLS